jgi:tRNA pseudouridine38-40 synthase
LTFLAFYMENENTSKKRKFEHGGGGRGKGKGKGRGGHGGNQYCFAFQKKGHCEFGSECRFSHDVPEGGKLKKFCFDLQQTSNCARGDACPFSHEATEGKIPPIQYCFAFQKKQCTRGDTCKFSHDIAQFEEIKQESGAVQSEQVDHIDQDDFEVNKAAEDTGVAGRDSRFKWRKKGTYADDEVVAKVTESSSSLSLGVDNKLSTESDLHSKERIPKKKVALLVMYKGTGYQGLQINKEIKTIERDMEEAIFRAGGISAENHTHFNKLAWGRSARTDKGVHAAGNVITLKLIERPNIVDLINEQLPNSIRVIAKMRVIQSFDAKRACSSRAYEYVLPSFAFHPEAPSPVNALPEHWKAFRLPLVVQDQMQAVLNRYCGTFNFHNFTCRREPGDLSCKRYIKSFRVDSLFVMDGVEFVRFRVHGQSFMLHQIRKMIGGLVACVRGVITQQHFEQALTSKERLRIPKAPSLGLFLLRPFFEIYDKKWTGGFGNISENEHKPSFASTFAEHEGEIEAFIHKEVYPEIASVEATQLSCWKWLWILDDPLFWCHAQSNESLDDDVDELDDDFGGSHVSGDGGDEQSTRAHRLRRYHWWRGEGPNGTRTFPDPGRPFVLRPQCKSSSDISDHLRFPGNETDVERPSPSD